MTTAAQVVAAALSERGYTESPPNSNMTKFAAEAGHANGHFWCATFTAAILKRTNTDVPAGVLTASTRANLAAWRQSMRFIAPDNLEPGDIVFYHLSGRNGNDPNTPDHTGIVVARINGPNRIRACEGNTSSDDHGSQDNGGGVYERTRNRGIIIGGGRPYYDTQETDDMTPEEHATLDATRTATAQTVDAVSAIQDQLKAILDRLDHAAPGGGASAKDVADELARRLTS